ncbi:MAG: hypothetical protein HYY84_10115 [Deltaproteobacteria bacterium]|nr:hypothetical protein [Deltaproteobacteria bacterium]
MVRVQESTSTVVAVPDRSAWINGWKFDVGWLIGSAAIVPVILFFVWAGASSDAINLTVTALIGAPHVFSTFAATYLDPRFRRTHRSLLIASVIAVPTFVVYWTLNNYQVLLSFFIFAASLHVLQQNAYLTDIYRKRARTAEPAWSRLIDYGFLFLSMYPVASYKLVHSNFVLGDVPILIPNFLMSENTYGFVWIAFAFFLVAWFAKTFVEHQRGTLNYPKTVLIAVTTTIAFLIPMAASGERLELAFQAVNTWHSLQYLGIVWYIQKVRKSRGLIESPFVARMSGSGRGAISRFVAFCLGCSALLFGLMLAMWKLNPLNLGFMQYYYMVMLSCLLIHYVLDAYLFTVSNTATASVERIPFAAPAA